MKESSGLKNQLKAIRTRLRVSQQELAVAAGVARQTIGGIEAELYAPSALVALRLAKALGCRVEEIFWLEDESVQVQATPAQGMPESGSCRVAMAQIAGRCVAHSLQGESAFRREMIPADGVCECRPDDAQSVVRLLEEPEVIARTVVLAGCTPALSLWARSAERWFPGLRVHWIHANSMDALQSLARGEVHGAGMHLCDPITGEYNAPYIRRVIPGKATTLVNLGVWEEGLLLQPGNQKGIQSCSDLVLKRAKLVNREPGSGARLLLDTRLEAASLSGESIPGYGETVFSHEEVGIAVATGKAEAGISTRAIAETFGLEFLPLQQARYDLVFLDEYLLQEPVRQLLSTLQHRWVRSQLELLGGYDTQFTGVATRVRPDGNQTATED